MMHSESTRKIVLDLAVSLDGFIEGPKGEVDWCIIEPEMHFTDFLNDIDTILYGRKSYDLWGQYVPENDAPVFEKEIWRLVHRKKKYVFSKTQNPHDIRATWISENIAEKMGEMKKEPGKNIWLYGGASLIATFVDLGLVDEYRLSIHPVILGEGKPLFSPAKQRVGLKLMKMNRFTSGVVQLCYQPKNR